MKRRIALLGPPASGKGTQAEMITARFQIPSASPGAMLREEKNRGTSLGLKADALTSQGRLVPDEMVCNVVESWLDQHSKEFVLDGFPRSTGQWIALDAMLQKRSAPLEVAFLLDADRKEIAQRVLNRVYCSQCGANLGIGMHIKDRETECPKCGGQLVHRADDRLEILEHRLAEYREKTVPVVECLRERQLLHVIDACRPPDLVFEAISVILNEHQ